tara:strand:- start:54661 stop:54876 length:216 start_codon:yes stop_codon:yes gene_type:complete
MRLIFSAWICVKVLSKSVWAEWFAHGALQSGKTFLSGIVNSFLSKAFQRPSSNDRISFVAWLSFNNEGLQS